MSHGYAVELYFDPALENQVLKAWNILARRQISTRLIEMEARPHLTLLASPLLDPSKLQSLVRSFAAKHEPIPLTLSSVSSFSSVPSSSIISSEGLLFLSPTPTSALIDLHHHLCDSLRKDGVEIVDQFLPNSWIPACSVAQDVPRSRIGEAFCILRDLKLPVSGYALDIGVVEFSPVRELFSFPLGNVSE